MRPAVPKIPVREYGNLCTKILEALITSNEENGDDGSLYRSAAETALLCSVYRWAAGCHACGDRVREDYLGILSYMDDVLLELQDDRIWREINGNDSNCSWLLPSVHRVRRRGIIQDTKKASLEPVRDILLPALAASDLPGISARLDAVCSGADIDGIIKEYTYHFNEAFYERLLALPVNDPVLAAAVYRDICSKERKDKNSLYLKDSLIHIPSKNTYRQILGLIEAAILAVNGAGPETIFGRFGKAAEKQLSSMIPDGKDEDLITCLKAAAVSPLCEWACAGDPDGIDMPGGGLRTAADGDTARSFKPLTAIIKETAAKAGCPYAPETLLSVFAPSDDSPSTYTVRTHYGKAAHAFITRASRLPEYAGELDRRYPSDPDEDDALPPAFDPIVYDALLSYPYEKPQIPADVYRSWYEASPVPGSDTVTSGHLKAYEEISGESISRNSYKRYLEIVKTAFRVLNGLGPSGLMERIRSYSRQNDTADISAVDDDLKDVLFDVFCELRDNVPVTDKAEAVRVLERYRIGTNSFMDMPVEKLYASLSDSGHGRLMKFRQLLRELLFSLYPASCSGTAEEEWDRLLAACGERGGILSPEAMTYWDMYYLVIS